MSEFKTKTPDEVLDLVSKASGALLLIMKAHFEIENMMTLSEDQKVMKKKMDGMQKKLNKKSRTDSCETLIGPEAFDGNNTDEDIGD